MTAELEISAQELSQLGDVQLVDVRNDAEYATSRIERARHIALDELARAAEELDRDRPVVFYCRVGERSAMAAEAFRASGWDARSLRGGLVAWADEGMPLDPPGAEVAQHSSIPTR